MQIQKEQREQHLSDMKSLIVDNRKQKKKFPTNEDFAELCGISVSCVKTYRKLISQKSKKALEDRFTIEKISSIEDTLDTLYENIEWYQKIKKDKTVDIDIRMSAAKLIEEARKNITEVMVDSSEMLQGIESSEDNDSNDNVLFNKEHLHGTEEKITEGIKSITD